jgi:nucleotide-binding universal stress UspA family protein
MSDKPTQVVVAFDFSRSGQRTMQTAVELARRSVRHVLHFVCVLDPRTGINAVPHDEKIDYRYAEKVQQELTAQITATFKTAEISNAVHFFVHARFGKPAEEILGLARDVGADVIVIGSKGLHGIERVVLGSVSEAVVREAGCSVMVARPKTYEDVTLLPVVKVETHLHYVPPHRYTYEQSHVTLRPNEWPMP